MPSCFAWLVLSSFFLSAAPSTRVFFGSENSTEQRRDLVLLCSTIASSLLFVASP